jgi:hypothetical protein
MIDFIRFGRAKARQSKVGKCDSGGTLFIMGGKTYYTMPRGQRRKIADYPLDLTPGSADMNQFTSIMEQARDEIHKEAKRSKMAAVSNIKELAREVAKK